MGSTQHKMPNPIPVGGGKTGAADRRQKEEEKKAPRLRTGFHIRDIIWAIGNTLRNIEKDESFD